METWEPEDSRNTKDMHVEGHATSLWSWQSDQSRQMQSPKREDREKTEKLTD